MPAKVEQAFVAINTRNVQKAEVVKELYDGTVQEQPFFIESFQVQVVEGDSVLGVTFGLNFGYRLQESNVLLIATLVGNGDPENSFSPNYVKDTPYAKPVTIQFESARQRDRTLDNDEENLYFPWECFVLSPDQEKIPRLDEELLINGRVWTFALVEFPNTEKFAYAGVSTKTKPRLSVDARTLEFSAAFVGAGGSLDENE